MSHSILTQWATDEKIHLWNLSDSTSAPIELATDLRSVDAVTFSPDSKVLIATDSARTIYAWNTDEMSKGPNIIVLGKNASGQYLGYLSFARDGQSIIGVGSDDPILVNNVIYIWNTEDLNAEPITLSVPEGDSIGWIAISPDGRTIASAGVGKTISLWNIEHPEDEPVVLEGHTDVVTSVAFSPNGFSLASTSRDGSIRIWNLIDTDQEPTILTEQSGTTYSVTFSPDGNLLASGSDDGTIKIWNLSNSNEPPDLLIGHKGSVRFVMFSPDGRFLLSGGDSAIGIFGEGTIRVWSLMEPVAAPTLLVPPGLTNGVDSIKFSPGGESLAVSSDSHPIMLWSLDSPFPALIELTGSEGASAIDFSPDGESLAAKIGRSVRLWNLAEPHNPVTMLENTSGFFISFTPDGQSLVIANANANQKEVQIFNIDDHYVVPRTLFDFPIPSTTLVLYAVSEDRRSLATISGASGFEIWELDDLGENQSIRPTTELPEFYGGIAISPDKTLLAGVSSQYIYLVRATDPNPGQIQTLVDNVANFDPHFSPDGNYLATLGRDNSVRLWETSNPDDGPTILTDPSAFTVAEFSPDGQVLATGHTDGSVRLWMVTVDSLVALACEQVRRNLSWGEWQTYLGSQEPYRQTCPNLPAHPSVTSLVSTR